MNGQVEMIWRMLRMVAKLPIVKAYINFALMYTSDNILPVLPIKDLISEDGETTTPCKLATGMKTSVSYLWVLFCPYVVQEATEHVGTKALNMRHQEQNGFCGIFVGVPQHQKGYHVYVLHKWKIVPLYYVVFGESFSSALAYT